MRLLLKQRVFSWLDSYDIYDEAGNTVFTVKGQLAWGHCFKVFDAYGNEVAMLKEKIFSFLSAFEIYIEGTWEGSKRNLHSSSPYSILISTAGE